MSGKNEKGEYAGAGVDYTQIDPFKQTMIGVGQRTLTFPNARGVTVRSDILHAHGTVFMYRGLMLCQTTEGLGNKNWIAEWMYQNAGTGRTYYESIGIDTALMAVNDLIAQGAMPAIYTDEVAAGESEWFADKKRAGVLAESFYRVCEMVGMALPAGESPSLKFLVRAELPVKSAPVLSGCVTGIIFPASRLITGENLRSGDAIIGAASSGIHANGISLVIKRAMSLPDAFLTRLPNGNTLGDEALIPTTSYVNLVEALLEAEVNIHAIAPGTGSGVAKVAFDHRPYRYVITDWIPEIPPLFRFMQELGVSLHDCLTTFNWGIGYYIFVAKDEADRVIDIGRGAGYDLLQVGHVEEGRREVWFDPEGITLPPPGE